MEPSDALRILRTFRYSLYESLHRRADALFELTDAILAADAFPSPVVHLSLQALHRRGWGSLYAALDRGRIDAEALRGLLARNPFAGGDDEHCVYAADVSVWPRCDAEASPGRGFYYHLLLATRPDSPSSPDGPTSLSPGLTSPARVGPLR